MNESELAMDERIPVVVLTGYLGSGKTTLLNALLTEACMSGTAVVMNEFGAVGVDHLLVKTIDQGVVLLANGCVCCATRGDLERVLLELYTRSAMQEIPPVQRIVLETSGLAQPSPLLAVIETTPALGTHVRLHSVITTVDASAPLDRLQHESIAIEQVRFADRVVITKPDLADEAGLCAVAERVRALRPTATQTVASHGHVTFAGWVAALGQHEPVTEHAPHDHGTEGMHKSISMIAQHPIAWGDFVLWLDDVLRRFGKRLLRAKGILDVTGRAVPTSVQCVGTVVYPPAVLPLWPGDKRSSRFVLIVRDAEEQELSAAASAFYAIARDHTR